MTGDAPFSEAGLIYLSASKANQDNRCSIECLTALSQPFHHKRMNGVK